MRNEKIYRAIHNPYKIVEMFEEEVAHYTGSKYAVAVDSCSDALFLCCKYYRVGPVVIPSKTYLSVPQVIIQAGGEVIFDTEKNDWKGIYQLTPYPIIDAAKRFTSGMYQTGKAMCLSFHIKKHLKIGKGGMILTDSEGLMEWLKRGRYEGRSEKLYHEDFIDEEGYNMYMTPEQAARGLTLMQNIELHNDDLEENRGYRDLRDFTLFKNCDVI